MHGLVIKLNNFKILPSLLHVYHIPQLQNIAIIPLFFWGEGDMIYVNYMSIIITIVSNITVLVSHIIFFGFFMPTSHGVNKKTPSSAYPTSISPYQVFIRFVCFTRNTLSPSFAVIRLFAKDNTFSKKIRFFLLAHCWSVLILLFCLCVFNGSFFTVLHHEITNLKLLLFFRIPRKLSLRLIIPP